MFLNEGWNANAFTLSLASCVWYRTRADIAAQTGLAGHHTTEEARKLEDKAQRAAEDADKARVCVQRCACSVPGSSSLHLALPSIS